LLSFLAKTLGKKESELAPTLFEKGEDDKLTETVREDALSDLLKLDAERVKSVRESVDRKEIFDEAYAKARKEEAGKLERKLAKEFGVDKPSDDASLVDYARAIIEAKTEGTKEFDPKSEEAVKAHPVYIALEKSRASAIDEVRSEYETKISDIESGYAKSRTLDEVKSKAVSVFDSLNPILSKDASKASNQKALFAERFEGYEYTKLDDGSYAVMNSEGKRIEDAHGNAKTLETLVRETAESLYDFAENSDRSSPGNSGTTGGGTGNIAVPKTDAEFEDAYLATSDPAARSALTKAYEASKADA